jgi:preprotein translocase subunit SecF
VIEAMRESVKDILENDPKGPIISIQPIEGPGEHMVKLRVLINENDKEAGKLTEVKDAFKGDPAIPLSRSPFTYAGSIGPAIAEELKETSVHAMIVAWVLIILYIALRFHGFGFGVAAVIAIIHDAIITIGIVSICGFLIPKAMGFNFEFSLSSVAAILAVIGYSVNDTIVIFDRIRENLILLKRETLRNIVNISINQNLSRTILTSLTTWVAVVTLYTVTLRASSGIETFAFPLIVGIIIGTYSSIYVASPLLLYWYRKGKPQVAG